jgi:secondary thiamine-phosphate synthase enzyme
MIQHTIIVNTSQRGLVDITAQVSEIVRQSGIQTGLANVFIRHTSASLTITENADPTVLVDLETIMRRLAPDADPEYQHNYEGDDDMAAHVRSVLTTSDLNIPICDHQLGLGTWQGIFLWEHRYRPHRRTITVTLIGD